MIAKKVQVCCLPRVGRGVRCSLWTGILFLLIVPGSCAKSLAQTNKSGPPNTTASVSAILERQTAKTFELIESYIQNHPQAPDLEQAYVWLLETAKEQGWETRALPLAERYLKEAKSDAPSKNLAATIRTIGWAKQGKWEEALLSFEKQLADVRLRTPTPTVELAQSLAVQAQIANKPDIARDVFQNLSRSLFLNPSVRKLCDKKLAKLKLVGQAAPSVSVRDLDDQPIDLGDYRGKWVLLDFWATNCAPCLEAFPQLKSLHETYSPQGFAIIGISLDEDADTVRAFQKQQNLTWKLALSETDGGQTRERYHVPTIPALYLINPQGKVQVVDPAPSEIEQVLQSAGNSAP